MVRRNFNGRNKSGGMGNKWEMKLGQGWEERKRMQFETVLFNTMWQKLQSVSFIIIIIEVFPHINNSLVMFYI